MRAYVCTLVWVKMAVLPLKHGSFRQEGYEWNQSELLLIVSTDETHADIENTTFTWEPSNLNRGGCKLIASRLLVYVKSNWNGHISFYSVRHFFGSPSEGPQPWLPIKTLIENKSLLFFLKRERKKIRSQIKKNKMQNEEVHIYAVSWRAKESAMWCHASFCRRSQSPEPRSDLHHRRSFFISILMTKTAYCEIEVRECTIGTQTFGPKLRTSVCAYLRGWWRMLDGDCMSQREAFWVI